MKKKNLNSLKLNKASISNLNAHSVEGGIIWSIQCSIIKLGVDIIASIGNDFEGDCVQSWGDDGCPTGFDGVC